MLAPPAVKCDSESETSSGFEEDDTDDVIKKPEASVTDVVVQNVVESVQVCGIIFSLAVSNGESIGFVGLLLFFFSQSVTPYLNPLLENELEILTQFVPPLGVVLFGVADVFLNFITR